MATMTIPDSADLIGDWIHETFGYNVEFMFRNEYFSDIKVHLPPITRENGHSLLCCLTLSIPIYTLFFVEDVSICDPKFFDHFKVFLEKKIHVFDQAVAQFMKDGTIPKTIG